ncbi:MAG: molybdopterin synthase [Halobacteriaceae archaeon]
MRVLGVVGDDDADLVKRLARCCRDRGRTAVVTRGDTDLVRAASDTDGSRVETDTEAYDEWVLGPDGWRATTTEPRDVSDLLDRLAETYDYALLGGFPDARVPAIVVGDVDPAGEVLGRVDRPADVSAAAVLDDLEGAREWESLASLVAAVTDLPAADRAGAVATFTGRVRTRDGPDDTPTERLEFDYHEAGMDRQMAAIRSDLADREGVHAVRLHHRTGTVEAGEDIVFVVVMAGHREEAFRAVSDGIDRLKDEVPLFKKEVTVADSYWAHEDC